MTNTEQALKYLNRLQQEIHHIRAELEWMEKGIIQTEKLILTKQKEKNKQ